MSLQFADLIAGHFNLTAQEKSLLIKTAYEITRLERRLFFQNLKPRWKEFERFLRVEMGSLSEGERTGWLEVTVESLLEKGGEPDLIDSLVMNMMGRLEVYRCLREKSEERGIRLKALTSFGGLSMVLFAVVIITALVLYILGR